MDLRRLEMFTAVVDHGTFTRAAAATFVSQPGAVEGDRRARGRARAPASSTGWAGGCGSPRRARALVGPPGTRCATSRWRAKSSPPSPGSSGIARARVPPDPRGRSHGRPDRAVPRRASGRRVTLADPDDPADLVTMVREGEVEIGIGDEPADHPGLEVHRLAEQDLLAVMPPGTSRRLGPTRSRSRTSCAAAHRDPRGTSAGPSSTTRSPRAA